MKKCPACKQEIKPKIKSVANVNKERMYRCRTTKNTFEDFKKGDKVKVISAMVDMVSFEYETGIVIDNTYEYLGIEVKFDDEIYLNDRRMESWNFNPKDLVKLKDKS